MAGFEFVRYVYGILSPCVAPERVFASGHTPSRADYVLTWGVHQ